MTIGEQRRLAERTPAAFNAIAKVLFGLCELKRMKVCIAGGAVVNPALASDIDVFAFGHGLGEKIEPLLQQIGHNVVEYPDPLTDDYQVMAEQGFKSFGTVRPMWSPWPIQLVAIAVETPEELLERFDLSVHMVALMPDFQRVTIPQTTKPGEPIAVYTEYARPVNTPRRLAKLNARYGTSEKETL